MHKGGVGFRFLGMLLLFLLVGFLSSPTMAEVTSCARVTTELVPCVSFIQGIAAEPSNGCCSGVNDTYTSSNSKADRVAVCNCIKSALTAAGSPIDTSRIRQIPNKCGLTFTLPPIDARFDCSKINLEMTTIVAG